MSVTEIGESIVGPMAAIVNSMWTTHTEIYLDKQYIYRCYPDIVHLKNRGKRAAKNMIHQKNTEKDTTIRLHERLGLTLVAEQYFDFGLALMKEIRKNFNQTIIKTLGDQSVEEGHDMLKTNEVLYQQFLSCVGERQLERLESQDDVFHMYTKLISKTFNARAGAETHKFKEDSTSRYAENAVDTALREGLKVAAKRKPKTTRQLKEPPQED